MMKRYAVIAALAAVGPGWQPVAAQTSEYHSMTVNTEALGRLVVLEGEGRTVDVPDALASTAWDLGFFGTDVVVNGGEGGPGGMVASCVCQNSHATAEELQAMSAVSELDDFLAIGAADVPDAADAWHPAAIAAAPWYRYNLNGQHMIWPTYNVYLIKREDRVFKIQVVGYYDAEGTPRRVTFRWAQLR